ncbi:hypothetical protein HY994_06200 [Candidatus Micrarchaeota archaeon]|nr:hypothetical protein [Candidatus Micrarchaeota archaeon]
MVFSDRLTLFLALIVLSGFLVAYFAQGPVQTARISELTSADLGRVLVLTGSVRWVNGTRLLLCQGSACVKVVAFRGLDGGLQGRWVAVMGRWQQNALFVESENGVDVLS